MTEDITKEDAMGSNRLSGRNKNLSEWLIEWRLHRLLQPDEQVEESGGPWDAERMEARRLVAPFDAAEPPKEGEIRLLSPELTLYGSRPIYLAILWKIRPSEYLVAPFSHFQTPANQHEIRLREVPPCMSVLSIWNARKLSVFPLARSWIADALSQDELKDARTVYRAFSEGASLPPALQIRVGTKIQHPLDPRYEYMDEEGEIWSRLFPQSEHLEQKNVIRFMFPPEMPKKTALAAASRTGFESLAPLESRRLGVLIHPFSDRAGGKGFLLVSDRSGQPSVALDGSSFATRELGIIGRIEGNQSIIETSFPTQAILILSDGMAEPLVPATGFVIPPDSYVSVLTSVFVNPDAVTVLTDSELRRLMDPLPRDKQVMSAIVGELYARAWLYGAADIPAPVFSLPEFTGLRTVFEQLLLPARVSGGLDLPRLPVVSWAPVAMAAWEYLIGRISSFLHADGFIPLVLHETNEAFPMAFSLIPYAASASRIVDMNQISIPVWEEANEIVNKLRADGLVLQLHCSLERTSKGLTGQSMEIPVVIGLARRQGILPEYSPLAVMATGAVQGEIIMSVAGLDAKLSLAQRMQVKLFIAPGVAESKNTMLIQPGTTIKSFIENLSGRLEQSGLATLDARLALVRLQQLGNEIHQGCMRMSEASVRLDCYEKIFSRDSSSKMANEGLIRVRVLRGAIANHTGAPTAGAQATTEAAKMARKAKMPLLYVNAMANRIVSLTDLGEIDQAEQDARALLKWVQEDFPGSAEDQMRSEMVARGVLGGQPLLIQALQGTMLTYQKAMESTEIVKIAGIVRESLDYLEKALEIAGQLNLPHDVCRDTVQVAHWHALLQTATSLDQYETAQAILNSYGTDVAGSSNAYLARTRFLAAYRIYLTASIAKPEVADWPLPEKDIVPGDWLYATALKYRGTILGARGEIDKAIMDFTNALQTLERTSSPLLHFIGGTVATQAGESLITRRDVAIAFLATAKNIFSDFPNQRFGKISTADWLARVEGIIAGERPAQLPNPQLMFPY